MTKALKSIALYLTISLTATTIACGASLDTRGSNYIPYYNHNSAEALARLMWAEARGVSSDTEKAAVAWCVINRVEAGYGTLHEVIKAPNQFAYYTSSPVDPHLYALAKDVLIRWDMERCGFEDVGRVLPKEYTYFAGDGSRNYFRDAYRNGTVWRWELPSPYEN